MNLTKFDVGHEGGLIEALLQEHQQGREHIAAMNKALEAKNLVNFKTTAIQYRDLLKNHIAKEDNDLFLLADQLLDEIKQDELFDKFENYEESVIGHGVHDELHSMIHHWEHEL